MKRRDLEESTMTTTATNDRLRYTRIGLAVAAVVISVVGITLIVAGIVTGQPGLSVVASSSMAAGGASLAAGYSTYRTSRRRAIR
ncbi:hypothetical protein [Tersicoccus solisilvae]|nr:hypothetical protein [Tersicoccus solisilvae]